MAVMGLETGLQGTIRALLGGMPLYKYIANRLLTAFENVFLRVKLSEYHTGYRAFSRQVLTELPLLENSDAWVSGATAVAFLRQFLEHCDKTGVPLDFISYHAKGRPTVVDGHVPTAIPSAQFTPHEDAPRDGARRPGYPSNGTAHY